MLSRLRWLIQVCLLRHVASYGCTLHQFKLLLWSQNSVELVPLMLGCPTSCSCTGRPEWLKLLLWVALHCVCGRALCG